MSLNTLPSKDKCLVLKYCMFSKVLLCVKTEGDKPYIYAYLTVLIWETYENTS